MSGSNPSAPAQPSHADAYTTAGNAADKEPAETAAAHDSSRTSGQTVERRVPQTQSSSIEDATPSALGRGVRGAPPGEEAQGKTEEDVGRHRELDAQQMAAPGEGRVYDAVVGEEGKSGAKGEERDFASDLDR